MIKSRTILIKSKLFMHMYFLLKQVFLVQKTHDLSSFLVPWQSFIILMTAIISSNMRFKRFLTISAFLNPFLTLVSLYTPWKHSSVESNAILGASSAHSFKVPFNPADTGRKLNIHKTFRRRPGRLLNVLCTFNLRNNLS